MANTKPELRSKADKRVIEYVSTSSLTPYARNSRTHSPHQVKQIAASIKEFGFTNPVLIDEANGIIAGHGRVMAAEHLQLAEVPCIRLSYLTETQKRAYVIADNKLALNAAWDDELLKLELDELHGTEYDLSLLGFDADELVELMGFLDAEASELPDLPTGEKDPWRQMTFKVHSDQEAVVLQAIEYAAGYVSIDEKYKFTSWLRSTGVSAKAINQATESNMANHYLTDKSQPDIPTSEMWAKFCHLVPDPPEEIDELIKRRTKQEEENANRNGNALYKISAYYIANVNS